MTFKARLTLMASLVSSMSVFLGLLFTPGAAVAISPPSTLEIVSSSCDDTTLTEIDCEASAADRAAVQLEKDWSYLSKLATTRNPESLRLFNAGQVAFQKFVEKNCESEGHDSLGGSLQTVLEQQCRRETLQARRRLFQKIGEPHKFGRAAEADSGRPICEAYLNEKKPLEISAVAKVQDIETLRKYLDRIGRRAARSGHYLPTIRALPRLTHTEAEKFREVDALFTCQGIAQAFCPNLEGRLENWLSRCQTDLRSAFYKKASVRLRSLQAE